ncbi:MAG: YicC family protein [Candidatus Bipolaricaulis sp.]|nr:YicC family protein [Candidatus Bipolaricaulis sp.]MDD5219971.1 YicC family protein [Candidatus Bipolaricaulis sp.]
MRSMTGFGAGAASIDGWRVEATIRSVNHRFLTVRVRSVGERPWLHAQIEEKLRGALSRGDVGVWLSIEGNEELGAGPDVDRALARRVHEALRALSDELKLETPPTLADLVRAGGFQIREESDEALWPAVERALDQALAALIATREREGALLCDELARLVDAFEDGVDSIEEALPVVLAGLRERLRERIEGLDVTMAPDRLEAEVVLYADRYDVQEELVRLKGHVARARELFRRAAPVGKELDFLGQEFLREINTLGSKARDSEIVGTVLDMKMRVEQMREQVQNVE